MTFADLLPKLYRKLHWRLFLCNLKMALDLDLLTGSEVRAVFRLRLREDIAPRDADSVLGNLKAQIHSSAMQLVFRGAAPGIPQAFLGGIVTVIGVNDLHYYRDPHDLAGHDFDRPGWVSRRFRWGACTPNYFWAAPSVSCTIDGDDGQLADTLRDMLGLVQHRTKTQLVAISLLLPTEEHRACRPTIVEALPNARFLQNHPGHPDCRLGYTVDLSKLATVAIGETIAGAPELLIEKVFLRDCRKVELRALGSTTNTRASGRSSRQFLRHILHILSKRWYRDVYSELEPQLR